ncbi:MAG: Panacea domain-containing protein [Candidatus Fimadaptatus sp.]|jgi:uncharacterized phage-associated protein
MYQLAHVANTILYRAKNEGISISPMKLQKLIYFLYAEYLRQEGRPLFAERFEVWRYGPVLDDVYQAFKEYRANSIRGYMVDVNGRYKIIDVNSDPCFKHCFDNVWYFYAHKTGIELSEITHQKSGAWYKALSKNQDFLNDQDILNEVGSDCNEQT